MASLGLFGGADDPGRVPVGVEIALEDAGQERVVLDEEDRAAVTHPARAQADDDVAARVIGPPDRLDVDAGRGAQGPRRRQNLVARRGVDDDASRGAAGHDVDRGANRDKCLADVERFALCMSHVSASHQPQEAACQRPLEALKNALKIPRETQLVGIAHPVPHARLRHDQPPQGTPVASAAASLRRMAPTWTWR